jgi:hypothetical protein
MLVIPELHAHSPSWAGPDGKMCSAASNAKNPFDRAKNSDNSLPRLPLGAPRQPVRQAREAGQRSTANDPVARPGSAANHDIARDRQEPASRPSPAASTNSAHRGPPSASRAHPAGQVSQTTPSTCPHASPGTFQGTEPGSMPPDTNRADRRAEARPGFFGVPPLMEP